MEGDSEQLLGKQVNKLGMRLIGCKVSWSCEASGLVS